MNPGCASGFAERFEREADAFAVAFERAQVLYAALGEAGKGGIYHARRV